MVPPCLSVLVVIGCLVAGDRHASAFDRDVADALPTGNPVLALCADLGNLVEITLLILVLSLAATRCGRRDLAVLVAAGPLVGAIGSTVVKHVFDRYSGEGLAYPSGHTTAVTALGVAAGMLAWQTLRPGLREVAVAAAVLVPLGTGTGVVTEEYHYASDSVGGFCLGVATTACLAVALSRRASPATSSAR